MAYLYRIIFKSGFQPIILIKVFSLRLCILSHFERLVLPAETESIPGIISPGDALSQNMFYLRLTPSGSGDRHRYRSTAS